MLIEENDNTNRGVIIYSFVYDINNNGNIYGINQVIENVLIRFPFSQFKTNKIITNYPFLVNTKNCGISRMIKISNYINLNHNDIELASKNYGYFYMDTRIENAFDSIKKQNLT